MDQKPSPQDLEADYVRRLGLTRHALLRAQERGVTLESVRLVLLLAPPQVHPRGFRFMVRGWRPTWVSPAQWSELSGVVVVVNNGLVMTVFRRPAGDAHAVVAAGQGGRHVAR